MNYKAMENKLTGKYREVFEKAELYGIVKNIDSKVQDEMMMDLLDLLLSAQEDHKPVEKIIGTDMEAFCKSYYQQYSLKERARHLPKRIYGLAKLVLSLQALEILFLQEEKISFLQVESDIAPYVIGLGIGMIFLFLIDVFFRPIIFKSNKLNNNRIYSMLLVLFAAAVIGAVVITDKMPVAIEIKSYSILIGTSLYIIIYLLVRSIYRYKKYGTIRKLKNIENEYENSSVLSSIGASIDSNLPKELAKRYENINKKRKKRGKQEITPEEYMELLRDETRKLSNTKGIMIFYIIFTAAIIMITAFTSEPADALIFAVIICTIEYSVYKMCKKANAGIVKARQKVFDHCEEEEKNIIEYAKENS